MPISFQQKNIRERNTKGNRMVSNWTPRHEAIVMDRIRGKTNIEISEEYGIHQTYVSTICNSWQGKALVEAVTTQVNIEARANFTEQRKQALIQAQQRMFDFVNNDQLQKGNQLACVGPNIKIFEVLNNAEKSIAPVVNNNTTNNTQVNVMLSDPSKRDRLAEGLAKADEVRSLHSAVTGESIDNTQKIKEPTQTLKLVGGSDLTTNTAKRG